jgi:hypothetical protein
MIGAGLSSTGPPAGARTDLRRTKIRPASTSMAAAPSSHGGRESRTDRGSGAVRLTRVGGDTGIGFVVRGSAGTGRGARELRDTRFAATTTGPATGGDTNARPRPASRLLETSRAFARRTSDLGPWTAGLAARVGRASWVEARPAGAGPRSDSAEPAASSAAGCAPCEEGCDSAAGGAPFAGAGTTGRVSRDGSSVSGST